VLAGLPNGQYAWRLRAIDSALNGGAVAQGTFNIGPVSTAPEPGLPTVYSLDAVFPNPFALEASIRYALPEAASVEVVVYDLLGRTVATLVDARQEAGFHELRWDGVQVASGTYLVRLRAGDFTATRTVTRAR
jgi:hypothetical protein